VSHLINKYADRDVEIERVIPITETILRMNPQSAKGYSPYQILFGHQPTIHLDYAVLNSETPPHLQHAEYIDFLKKTLLKIHEDVDQKFIQQRTVEKTAFDKRNKVSSPQIYKIGQKVLLKNYKPPVNSDSILCHKKYKKIYIITDVVARESTFDPKIHGRNPELHQTAISHSYQITDIDTGRVYGSLVPSKRLKLYYDRDELNARYPPRQKNLPLPPAQELHEPRCEEPPDCIAKMSVPKQYIIRKRLLTGKLQYLVRDENKEVKWLHHDDVQPLTIQQFNNRLIALKRRRQAAARRVFNEGYAGENKT
jgi:hypothetical protein